MALKFQLSITDGLNSQKNPNSPNTSRPGKRHSAKQKEHARERNALPMMWKEI